MDSHADLLVKPAYFHASSVTFQARMGTLFFLSFPAKCNMIDSILTKEAFGAST